MTEQDIKDAERRYAEITSKANNGWNRSVLDRLRAEREQRRAGHNTIFNERSGDFTDIPTCQTQEQNEARVKPEDIPILKNIIDGITKEVSENILEFPDIASGIPEISTSKESGSTTGLVQVMEYGQPQWVSELEIAVEDFADLQRDRSKDWYDPEDLTYYGVEAREGAKKLEPKNVILIMLDTSGSMMGVGQGGKSFLEIMASYIPPIVEEYEGAIW
jgi:hypothetical protein